MNYSGSPRISTEYRDCSMPMAFDQHKGCSFKCLYCFAYYQREANITSRNDYSKNIIKSVNVKKVIDMFEGKIKNNFYYDNFIKKRKVIQWGALGDPFCMYEKQLGTALPILKKLNQLKYPVSFSTKSTWFTEDDRYMNIFKEHPENWHFKFSIITSDKDKASKIELGVPAPQERFKAMKRLSDIGIATTLRLRPFFIGLTDLDLEETIRQASESGAISVSTEFFCYETRATFRLKQRYKQISKLLGYDISRFYNLNSSQLGYKRLNKALKKPYIERLIGLCSKYSLKLYISDPHFKELSHHGSCCGLPEREPFINYSHAQLLELIKYMQKNNKQTISWSEYLELFKEDFEWQNNIMAGESHNFGDANRHKLRKNQTILDYNKCLWNNPNSLNSPFKYFEGLFKPLKLDKNRDIIYELT